jgi:CRP/FNR family transcriptional regulator, cyclic AMP receptor protein
MSMFQNVVRATGRLFRRVFRRRIDARTQEIVDLVQDVPAFEHCSTAALYALAEAMHRRSYRRGEVLYYEGDPGLGLYVIEQGRIQLRSESEPGMTQALRDLRPGEAFGVLSVLGDFTRLETAETLTEARVLGFFRPDLKNIIKRNPSAGAEIMLALSRWIGGQHVELVHVMMEQSGREVALQSYAEAASMDRR